VARALGIDGPLYLRQRARLEEAYLAALADEMSAPDDSRRILPGVEPLLDLLRERPEVTLGLLTGNIERGARTKLEAFGLNRYFAGGGFGSDHEDRREIARLARVELSRRAGVGFADRSVVVVGDTALDVDCARANGFTSVAVASGWGSRESLELADPDSLLPDLSDLEHSMAALGLSGSTVG
jgi:phosphoglycolate phosphatase-like HAD superfamily hydrolase